MNKEVGYIWQGFLLLLVVLTGMGVVRVLASMRVTEEVDGSLGCGTADVQSITKHGGINSAGLKLFQDNCATCHKIDKDLTGPALRGIEDRVKDKKLLYSWIRNNAVVLKSGNPYFTELYNKWNRTAMNAFPSLTDEEIEDILDYIR
jgi:cytochrome c2